MRRRISFVALTLAAAAVTPSSAQGQVRTLRVLSADSMPVVYAYVTFDGGDGKITDEKGEISLGKGKTRTLTVNARRIGFQPWFGKLTFPDTAATLTVVLPAVAQHLGEIVVTANNSVPQALKGFYDRWTLRQKGLLTAVFIAPEEIEFRHPNKITNMLYGINGVSLVHNEKGDQVAMGDNGQCQMAIMLDGIRVCPSMGCNSDAGQPTGFLKGLTKPRVDDAHAVVIDHLIDAASVDAIEVYPRGGNMPSSLSVSDAACGVIAFWTGTRKP
jgi:hypothetical protein